MDTPLPPTAAVAARWVPTVAEVERHPTAEAEVVVPGASAAVAEVVPTAVAAVVEAITDTGKLQV